MTSAKSILLSPDRLQRGIDDARAALARGRVSALRAAARTLADADAPEIVAELAEEGLARASAARTPGAVDEDGALVLADAHQRLIHEARRLLTRLHAAIAAHERAKVRSKVARALAADASGEAPLPLEAALALAASFFASPDDAVALAPELADTVTPLRDLLERWPDPRARFEAARLSWIGGPATFPHARFEAASEAGSLAATRTLRAVAYQAGDLRRGEAFTERAIDQGEVLDAYDHAVIVAGHAARASEGFAAFVRIARVTRVLPADDFAIVTCVQAATRASCMMRRSMVPPDEALLRELAALVEPHRARHASAIDSIRRLFGLR